MSARSRPTRRTAAVLAMLLIACVALPGVAGARPAPPDPAAPSSEPAPTVVRTVIREDSLRALPIALAGAALLIAIGGTGLALVRIAPMRHQLH